MDDTCGHCGGSTEKRREAGGGYVSDMCVCCRKCSERRHHETGPYDGCSCCECEYRRGLPDSEIAERTSCGTTLPPE